MGYLLPRAVIVLIAWGTTCLIMNFWTSVDPLVFYVAGGVWAFVGLICFFFAALWGFAALASGLAMGLHSVQA